MNSFTIISLQPLFVLFYPEEELLINRETTVLIETLIVCIIIIKGLEHVNIIP